VDDTRPTNEGAAGPRSLDRVEQLLGLVDRLRDDPRLTGVLVVLAALALGGGWLAWRTVQPAPGPRAEDILPRVQLTPTSGPTTSLGPVLVHVVGEVRQPGVRELAAGARILDAVEAAGGPTAAADLAQLNLAAPVADGSQVRVPAFGEPDSGPLVIGPGGAGDGPAGPGPVDLNTATAAQLESLPGVGPATASAIVAWRDANGRFASVEQLLEVRGIGPAKLEAVRDLVVVR
jgi:competence protein ComEA